MVILDNHGYSVTSNITLHHFDDSFSNINYLAYAITGTFEHAPYDTYNSLRACLDDHHETLESLMEGALIFDVDEDFWQMQLPISHFSYIAWPTIASGPFPNSISTSGCSSNIAIQVQVLSQPCRRPLAWTL